MKKILSILATITGAFYLAAGIGLLVFQNTIKEIMGYSAVQGVELINVYPIQILLELALLGFPCVVLGILSMSESAESNKNLNLLMAIYSGVMLVVGGLLANIGGLISNYTASKFMGVEGMVNISLVTAAFGWIEFMSSLSLVLLLVRSAFSLGEIKKM